LRAKTCFPSEFLYPPEMRFHQETDRMWIVPQIPTPSRLASFSEMLWFCKQHRTSSGTQWRPGNPYLKQSPLPKTLHNQTTIVAIHGVNSNFKRKAATDERNSLLVSLQNLL